MPESTTYRAPGGLLMEAFTEKSGAIKKHDFVVRGTPAQGHALLSSESNLREAWDAVPWKDDVQPGFGRLDYVQKIATDSDSWFSWRNGDLDADSPDFIGSPEQATEMYTKGWARGVGKLSDLVGEVKPMVTLPTSIRPRWTTTDDVAEFFDPLRVMQGEDDPWEGLEYVEGASERVVRLLVPIGGHCGLTIDELFWNGAAAVVICDLLQNAGYAVEIIGYHMCRYEFGNRTRSCNLWTVKQPQEYVTLSALAFQLCHPAAFRGLSGFYTDVVKPGDWDSGYGKPKYLAPNAKRCEHTKWLRETGHLPPQSIVLPRATDRDECVKAIVGAFESMEASRLGVAAMDQR